MSSAELISCANCPFSTLTQKGLTIHLRKMHQIVSHDRKPRRTQNRRQGIRLANCSMSAKSWGLPFVCVICGYRTAEKLVIKDHVESHQMREGERKFHGSQCEPGFSNQAGTSSCMDRRSLHASAPQHCGMRHEFKPITNCHDVLIGYSSKPQPPEMLHDHPSFQQCQFHDEIEQAYLMKQGDTVSMLADETCSEDHHDDDEEDNEGDV